MVDVIGPDQDGPKITLLASRSLADGKGIFPRIPSHSPVAHLYEDAELSGTATLYSFTIIHPNPKTGKAPFALVYADFGAQARVFGRLEHPVEEVVIGMRLQARAAESEAGATYHFVVAGEN